MYTYKFFTEVTYKLYGLESKDGLKIIFRLPLRQYMGEIHKEEIRRQHRKLNKQFNYELKAKIWNTF